MRLPMAADARPPYPSSGDVAGGGSPPAGGSISPLYSCAAPPAWRSRDSNAHVVTADQELPLLKDVRQSGEYSVAVTDYPSCGAFRDATVRTLPH
jgi:hypothetical protein